MRLTQFFERSPGNEYQTLQKAITTTGTGASTADILAAINALKAADATTPTP